MTTDRTGIVFDIKKYAIHDGPGIRTTVFLKGCPLRCAWCHNPEGLDAEPEMCLRPDRCMGCGTCIDSCDQGALTWSGEAVRHSPDLCARCGKCAAVCPALARELAGQRMPVSRVVAEVLKDQLFYDESGGGVTFSGGEPLAQPDFLLDLLDACAAHEIHRCLDTSGYAAWDTLAAVAARTDLFLYDIKHVDSNSHRRATGVGNDLILGNLRRLDEIGAAILVRLPLIPGFNDDADTVEQLCDLLKPLAGVRGLHLLPYHDFQEAKYRRFGRPSGDVKATGQPVRSVDAVADQIGSAGLTVEIGG